MGVAVNWAGVKHGRLTALNPLSDRNGEGAIIWECLCDCGKLHRVPSNRLAKTGSCGCLRTENHLKKITKHKSLDDGAAFCVYRQYQASAKKRGLEFDYPLPQFLEDILKDCHYCGSSPSNVNKGSGRNQGKANLRYSGIDRIDNAKGYIVGNVRPCCKACNVAKNNRTQDEFMAWIKRIHDRSL